MSDPFAALRLRFVDRCASDLVLIRGEFETAPGAASIVFKDAVHKLSGASGAFGFPTLSQLAARVDDELAEGRQASPSAVSALIDELVAVCAGQSAVAHTPL